LRRYLNREHNSWPSFAVRDYLNLEDTSGCSFVMQHYLNLEDDSRCYFTLRDEYLSLPYWPRSSFTVGAESFYTWWRSAIRGESFSPRDRSFAILLYLSYCESNSYSSFSTRMESPLKAEVDGTTEANSHRRHLYVMSYPETGGATSELGSYQTILPHSYLILDWPLQDDDPIRCFKCDKTEDNILDGMSTWLGRSRRLKLFGFMGFGVLALGVLILLRSGFTWSGIGSRLPHWEQSRSTKMPDYTSEIRRDANRVTRAIGQILRTYPTRTIFVFRVSCLPFILVCHHGPHLTLQSILIFGRWPF
jgi:hypothetical protein